MQGPHGSEAAAYGFMRTAFDVRPGITNNVGDIAAVRLKVKALDRGGDLGFTIKTNTPETDPAHKKCLVSHVENDGPASKAGLQVGDEIIAVNGYDVRGNKNYLFSSLIRVPQGISVKLSLKNGRTMTIKAGNPI